MKKTEHRCGICKDYLYGIEIDEEYSEDDPEGDGDRYFREYEPCPTCGAVNKTVYTLSDVIVIVQPRYNWEKR